MQTIEATGKRWKTLFVFGVLLALLSLAAATVALSQDSRVVGVVAGVVGLLGIGVCVVALVGGWWQHG